MLAVAVIFGAAGLSLILTGLLRRYALARSVLDIPNERSSHTVPTPRGGGVAITVSFLLGVLLLAAAGLVALPVTIALFGAGTGVALIGFLDDHGGVAPLWRLLAHFAAAAWALAWLGGLPPVLVLGHLLDLGWLAQILAAVYLVWLLNLYNFMDGIDGIASIEAITVCGSAALLACLTAPAAAALWTGPVLLLSAVAGFLAWNFPPAKIFMGDAGSGFMGLTLGVLSIQAARSSPNLFWAWVILLGVFVVDATVTLIRRVKQGKPPAEPHRSHAYQYAARRAGAHRPVILAVGAINLLWLLPIAALVVFGWLDGVFGVVLAYAPLIFLAFRLKAGAGHLQEI